MFYFSTPSRENPIDPTICERLRLQPVLSGGSIEAGATPQDHSKRLSHCAQGLCACVCVGMMMMMIMVIA